LVENHIPLDIESLNPVIDKDPFDNLPPISLDNPPPKVSKITNTIYPQLDDQEMPDSYKSPYKAINNQTRFKVNLTPTSNDLLIKARDELGKGIKPRIYVGSSNVVNQLRKNPYPKPNRELSKSESDDHQYQNPNKKQKTIKGVTSINLDRDNEDEFSSELIESNTLL
jgi:hypothetical protein